MLVLASLALNKSCVATLLTTGLLFGVHSVPNVRNATFTNSSLDAVSGNFYSELVKL